MGKSIKLAANDVLALEVLCEIYGWEVRPQYNGCFGIKIGTRQAAFLLQKELDSSGFPFGTPEMAKAGKGIMVYWPHVTTTAKVEDMKIEETMRVEWNGMGRVLLCKVGGEVVAQYEVDDVNTPAASEQAKAWCRDLGYDWDGRIHTSFGSVDCR